MTAPGRGRVIHTGQALVDLVMRVPALPEPGGDVFAPSHRFLAGGGFNAMAAAARDGAEVLYPGGHGTGPFGQIVREALGAEGISVLAPATPDHDSGFSIALVDDSAERTFVSTRGAETHPDPRMLQRSAPRPGDVVCVSGYSMVHARNRDALLSWLPRLEAGVTVVVDPGPVIGNIDDEALEALWARADVWTTNSREARILAQRWGNVASLEDAPHDRLAQSLARRARRALVLRTGAQGSLLTHPDGHVRNFPAPRVEAVDTNGAGDAHTGVLAACLAAGRDLDAALVRAGAAAAIAVTREGPATAPLAAETDALLGDAES